jgi:nitrous oxidase accessory protein NosD
VKSGIVAASAAVLVASLVHALGAGAATVGVVAGPGTPIQDAIDAAQPGDTVALALGTYAESIVVTKPLTISGPATLIDDDCSRAVLVTVASDGVRLRNLFLGGGSFAAVDVQGRQGVRLERLVFSPGRFLLGPCPYRPEHALNVAASRRVRITGNEAIGTAAVGSYSGALVALSDIPTYANVRAARNYLAFPAARGILVEDSVASAAHRAMAKGVSITGNTLAGPWATAVELRGSHGVSVASNFVANAYESPGVGVLIDSTSGNTLVRGNVFASNLRDVVAGFNDCIVGNRTDELQRCLW